MLHVMLDAYGSESPKLDDLKAVYEMIYKVITELGLKAVMPPILVPYYYGKVQEDDGISAFVFLKGGHFTIHTFPKRECYFVDLLYDGFFNEDKLAELLARELPFQFKHGNTVDRRFSIDSQVTQKTIDESADFGPHYLIRVKQPIDWNIDGIFHFLDSLPAVIGMDSILRPVVITDKIDGYSFYSGINVIAQSHIAVHYEIASKIAYIDVFSCSFIHCENLLGVIENNIGVPCECTLISRGSKHAYKVTDRAEIANRYCGWQKVIRGE